STHCLTIGTAGVDRSQAIALRSRNEETRILEAQRLGDAVAGEIGERHAGGLLHHTAQNIRVVTIDKSLTGLGYEGQRPEAFHTAADGLALIGGIPAITCRWT